MNPTAAACNYALLRFRPDAESGEFANVGLVLWSETAGIFDFCCDARCWERVHAFFPRVKIAFFERAMDGMAQEIVRVKKRIEGAVNAQTIPVTHGTFPEKYVENLRVPNPKLLYRELIRPREGILTFGTDATALSEDPKALKSQLIARYLFPEASVRDGGIAVGQAA
jgi:hypothetical protein